MISICIPIYNFNVSSFVEAISQSANATSIPFEIILIDDASSTEYKVQNLKRCEQETYIQLEENIGRSKIRNLFLKYAKYEYLLFLDCDGKLSNDKFIHNYLVCIQTQKPDLVCGGRIYQDHSPSRKQRLRWKYGILKESQTTSKRLKNPNQSFMTNNFLIRKDILEQIPFNETLRQYGHEDTLLGFELKKANISITHIDNPVINNDIEENSIYLEKTKKGIYNLASISIELEDEPAFLEDVTLLGFHQKVKNWKLATFLYLIFLFSKPFIYYTLNHGFANLTLFNFYKWGLFVEARKKLSR